KKRGIEEIRIEPTYNPYTEPSLEIQAFSPKLKRWLEVGNSGVFRPETLKPFGINKNIVAWGFGMERMLNLKLGMADIRDLYGAYTDLDLLREIESARVFGEF
ncbi:MAG: phenylalanine--tRNA ligase subunit alpha, partial [Candidatus Parvarchaeum sp.]|nr:phenylalanine--tRNA ligase subunit alpha [Candidatus Parvarchaeum tengchongense]